jgi:heterodisulfide reductase subunit C
MELLSQIIFIIVLSVAVFFGYKSVKRIRRNILLGRDEKITGDVLIRLKTMTLVALGQKKMFKKPIPAVLHLAVYLGFIIVNLEMLEIVIDGIIGTHRVFAPFFGVFYASLINVFETFAVLVIIACVVFLIRRNVLHVARFEKPEMTALPKRDANIILITEIVLMCALLTMNASDMVMLERGVSHSNFSGAFYFSGFLVPLIQSIPSDTLAVLERVCWWLHIIGVLAFANYVVYKSKHLHIFLAFINTYYSKLSPVGGLENMESVTKEVKSMLNIPTETVEATSEAVVARFGAKDANDLTWKNLLDAYSCTECGRCTQQCPANITGKKLSPRKVMMDTRTRIEEIGNNIDKNGTWQDDGKSLIDNYITTEEILACTTCNACVEACPINIDPVSIIVQLRQYQLMELSKAPAAWNSMLSSIENNGAPWKFPPSDRANWVEKLNS